MKRTTLLIVLAALLVAATAQAHPGHPDKRQSDKRGPHGVR